MHIEGNPWMSDISKRDDFKELTAKGGRVKSERKSLSAKANGSKRAKCRNLDCDFKEMSLKKDANAKCLVPSLRTVAIRDCTKVVNMDDHNIKMYMDDIMSVYLEYCLNTDFYEDDKMKFEVEKMKRLNMMFAKLKEFKELWSPAVQKNVNVNVGTNFDKMKERFVKYQDTIVATPKDI